MGRPRKKQAANVAEVPDDVWTQEQVAAYFKVSDRTIREWREVDATFPPPLDLPGRTIRWYRQDIISWALSLRGVSA